MEKKFFEIFFGKDFTLCSRGYPIPTFRQCSSFIPTIATHFQSAGHSWNTFCSVKHRTFIRIENLNQQLVASKVSRTLNSFKCVHLPWNAVTTFHGTRAHSTRIGHDVKCENSNSFQCPILCVKLKLFQFSGFNQVT